MFRHKSRSAAPSPGKELERLISAEERLAAMLREVEQQAASVVEEASREAATIEAKAVQEAEAEVDRLKVALASEREAALRRLGAEADREDWGMGPAEVAGLADRLVLELLAAREATR
jgi:hypothetical protein